MIKNFLGFLFTALFLSGAPGGVYATQPPLSEGLKTLFIAFEEEVKTSSKGPAPSPVSRAALAQKIAEYICPRESLEAFKSFQPLRNVDPAGVAPSPQNEADLAHFLTIIDTMEDPPENSLVYQVVGRLLLVGFQDARGEKYFIGGGCEGLRSLFFAYRDRGQPYAIQKFMHEYDAQESPTCNAFFAAALAPLIQSKTPEGRDLYDHCPPLLQDLIVSDYLPRGWTLGSQKTTNPKARSLPSVLFLDPDKDQKGAGLDFSYGLNFLRTNIYSRSP